MFVSIPTALSSLLVCFASRILTPRHRFSSNPCSSTSALWCLQTPKRRPPPPSRMRISIPTPSQQSRLKLLLSPTSSPSSTTSTTPFCLALSMPRRKIAPAGKVAISSASAPRQQPPIASVSPIPPCPVVWNAYTRTWAPRHTQRGYSPDMQRFATPQPVSRQPVITRGSQPIGTKPPLNNAAVYLAAAGCNGPVPKPIDGSVYETQPPAVATTQRKQCSRTAPAAQPATSASNDPSSWAL